MFSSTVVEETKSNQKIDHNTGKEQELEEISFGGSAATEYFKKQIEKAFRSNLPSKHISVKYEQKRFDIEVSTILTLPALYNVISGKFKLKKSIDYIYRLEEDDVIVVTHTTDLKANNLYYINTTNDPEPVAKPVPNQSSVSVGPEKEIKSMKDFYTFLGSKSFGRSEVETIEKNFDKEGISIEVLNLLTDHDLKEIGFTQLGFRKRILKALGKIN